MRICPLCKGADFQGMHSQYAGPVCRCVHQAQTDSARLYQQSELARLRAEVERLRAENSELEWELTEVGKANGTLHKRREELEGLLRDARDYVPKGLGIAERIDETLGEKE